MALFGGSTRLRAEKARLEAFLSAVPGEYCGWGQDQSVVYSQGFCDALGLQAIDTFIDIQNILSPDDSASLEGVFNRLRQDGIPFTMNVQNRAETKTFKISGTRGMDLAGRDSFYILWLEDISDLKSASDIMMEEQDILRSDIDRLQETLDALPHPVWIRDEHQKIIWCNVAYAKIVGAPPSEIIAQQKEIISVSKKRKPSEKDCLLGGDLARVALEEGVVQVTKLHEVLNGNRLWLKISEIPLKAQNISVGMAEDLTEEERILDETKDNRAANRALLEQLRSAIGIYDVDQKLEFYNSAFAQLWGLEDGWLNTRPTLGEIMEKLRETRRLPEQADFRVFKKSWLNMFTGLIDPYETMLYLPDGSAVRMFVVPHKLGGLMMTFEDVTSRLELESSYNTLIAVQKETLDNLAEAVAVYGGDGRLKLWNPSFGRLWSLDPETFEGEPHVTQIVEKASSFFNQDEWADVKELLTSLALDRSMMNGRLERMDMTLVDYSTVPLPDGGVLITYTDVTDTVRVENALREKNAALEEAEQLKIDFLANVSYQLRTPLNAIMGFNEMLAQEFFGPLNDKQKEYTHDIHGASESLLNLINDILDLSSIEAGQMDLDIEKTSIKAMMESVMELVEDWARKENIEVSLVCPANIGSADIDVSRMKQGIINIVRNSIAYTEAGGRIELRAARSGSDIKISVKDNGKGIAPEDQNRVLQPFERVDSVQQDSRGAGLGLSLVQNIVTLHGGVFNLDSTLGEGTTVTLILPKVQA
ncbi:MAG: histidine kinase [Alphaproteobacteria bacterium]|nr:MAG: histidine kinase [Alphaproteobacteria bacterium]